MSNIKRCKRKLEELKRAVSADFDEDTIGLLAERLDFNVENRKPFVGVESLLDYLEHNLFKAIVAMAKSTPGSSGFQTANGMVDNYLVLVVLIERATEHVVSELNKEAKKIAERN